MNSKQYEEDWERRRRYLIRSMFAEPSYLSPIPEHAESRSSPEPISPERESSLPDALTYYRNLLRYRQMYERLVSNYESESDDFNVPEELRSDSRNVEEAVKDHGETNSFPDNDGEEFDSERGSNVSVYQVVEEERSASSSNESEVDHEETESSSENQTEEEKDESDVSAQNNPGNFARIAENYKVDREKTKSSSENQTEEEKDESDVSAQNNPGNFARIAENYSNYQKTPEESVDENGQDSDDAEEISLDDREQTCEGGRDNSGTQDERSSSTRIPSTYEIIESVDENGQDSDDAEEISLDDREQTCEGGRDNSGTQDERSSSTRIPSTYEIIESVDENGQDSDDAEEISLDDREQTCEGGRDNSGTQDERSSSTRIPSTYEIIEALVHTSEREIECMRQQENRMTIHSLERGLKGPGLEDFYVEPSPGLNTCHLTMERLSGATDNLSAYSTTVEMSPIIGFKRSRAPEAIEAKKKKIDAQMDVENEVNKDVAVQVTPVIENVAVQADIRKIVRNNEAQAEELQTLINERVRDVQDFCVQYRASHNNVGIQTVTQDFGDASTQTEFEYFRNFRIYIGEINLFFT